MSTESRKHLRTFCTATNCRIWKAIESADQSGDAELRQYCSEQCLAYQFNRWLHVARLKIVKDPKR